MRYNKKGTLTAREIQTAAAVRLALPGELAKHAVSEGPKAVTVTASLCKSQVRVFWQGRQYVVCASLGRTEGGFSIGLMSGR